MNWIYVKCKSQTGGHNIFNTFHFRTGKYIQRCKLDIILIANRKTTRNVKATIPIVAKNEH